SYRRKADEADDDYQDALVRAQRAADAYRMRAQVARGASGGTTSPGEDRNPGLPERASEPAILVSQRDFDVCTENSVKINQAWEWAKTLNVEPMPSPEFARP